MFLESTSKFKRDRIVYQSPEFAIASGYWDGNSKLSLACRWYADGIGYPQTFGKPQWMALPANVRIEVKNPLDPTLSEVFLLFPAANGAEAQSCVGQSKVFFHTRDEGHVDWENQSIPLSALARLPGVGEYISLGNDTPNWHRVVLVVHVTFPAEYVAEVFCVRVNHLDAMKGTARDAAQ
jgi:hypothetical protein